MSEILANLMTVLDEEHARAVIDHRRVTIKKPLTAYGAGRLAKKLAAWGNANEAADIMIDKVWQGFEVEWVKSRPQQRTGKRNFADVAMDKFNGTESVFGSRRDVELVSTGHGQSGSDDGNLRGSLGGYVIPIRH